MKRMSKSVTMETSKIETQLEPTAPVHRRQVGILGGSFNPVHVAHLTIADQVRHQLGLDEVRLMPSYLSPHVDEKKTIDSSWRLKMLELAIVDNPELTIERCEIERQGKSYTIDTMRELTRRHPGIDFYFIIGGDMVDYLSTWQEIDELLTLVKFVGVKRPGYPEESAYPIIWVDVPQMSISSSEIRRKVAQGCTIRYLVPELVREYIMKEGLYLDDNALPRGRRPL